MHRNNDKTDEVDRWKTKYLHNLDELERKEKEWTELETLLHRGIGRLAVAGYGVNPRLDKKLDKLREAIRRHRTSHELDKLIGVVSDTATRLKEPDGAIPQGPIKLIAALMEEVKLPPGLAKEAEKLQKRLNQARESDNPAPYIEGFTGLLRRAMENRTETAGSPEAPAASGPQPGLLKRFLSREKPPPDAPEPPPSPPEQPEAIPTSADSSSRTLRVLLERCELPDGSLEEAGSLGNRCLLDDEQGTVDQLIGDIAAFLSRCMRGPGEENPAVVPEPEPAANEILLQLLELFEVSEDMREQVEALKASLAHELPPKKLPPILESMAQLVADIRRTVQEEKKEIETFLKSVTDRLVQLENNLQRAASSHQESLTSGQEFKNTVSTHVAHMRTSVADATDLEQLKSSIVEGLDGVQEHMETYILAEEKRNRKADQHIQELGTRVHDMELDAKNLHKRMLEQRAKASRDALTGLRNRQAYDERLQQEYVRWKRYHEPLSIAVIDIDHFKALNDTYGHQAGDKALKALAGKVRESVREADFVARYGGEEFVIIMPNTRRDPALGVAEKLRQDIATCSFHYREQSVQVTVSCGVAEFHGDDFPEAVFRRGDDALYQAKRNGRNQCRLEELAE